MYALHTQVLCNTLLYTLFKWSLKLCFAHYNIIKYTGYSLPCTLFSLNIEQCLMLFMKYSSNEWMPLWGGDHFKSLSDLLINIILGVTRHSLAVFCGSAIHTALQSEMSSHASIVETQRKLAPRRVAPSLQFVQSTVSVNTIKWSTIKC